METFCITLEFMQYNVFLADSIHAVIDEAHAKGVLYICLEATA